MFYQGLKQFYQKVIHIDPEYTKAIQLIQKHSEQGSRILDVGCGYGRFLKPLTKLGFKVTGLEKNPKIVTTLKQEDYDCQDANHQDWAKQQYDLILMSHIIEHFAPQDLLTFMEKKLQCLKKGGHLVILTPLYSAQFYDDFDHVKPYQPTGLSMVFGQNDAQVQYQAQNKLQLVDLWFRKSPLNSHFNKALYLQSVSSIWHKLKYFTTCVLFRLSFGWLGKKDGWIGVYQKI